MGAGHDAYGAQTTTTAAAALAGIDDFVTGFVGYHPRSANVLAAAEAHPDSALANILAGFLWMFLERPEAPAKAEPFRRRAADCKGLNRRERGLLALLEAWQGRDARRALSIARDVLAEHPEDLATLKLGQYHAFNLADAPAMLSLALGCRAALERRPVAGERTVDASDGAAGDGRVPAPLLSMLAFGHEQCHHLEAAERAAFTALDADPAEPWAHHALSHVFLTRGAIDEGRRFLAERAHTWTGLNSFMFTHNWWHLALFEIAAGEGAAALATFDARVWGVEPDYSQDQINAVSLLARLECAGVDVGERWLGLLPHLVSRVDDVLQPFVTLHYLYGLARAEAPEAEALLALIERQADEPVIEADRALWRDVGIAAARGVHAHAKGEHDAAVTHLWPVQPRLWMTGGSHAQRDLFDQLLLDAMLKAGRWRSAQPLLELRRRIEPDNPLVRDGLAEVHARLGLAAPS